MKQPSPKNERDSTGRRRPSRGQAVRGATAAGVTRSLADPWWRRVFSIDPRSLAAFRIGIGFLLLLDLAIRATDMSAMYTDDGMFSRAEICRRYTTIWNWSFHFGGGSWGFQAALFALAALLALALLIGFETRLATLGSWLMLLSLQHRVPPILNGGDGLLRMLLFWGMFLPLESEWSLDRWRKQRRGWLAPEAKAAPVFSVAAACILLQMAAMYFFSAVFKSNLSWLKGEVIAGALAHDFYAKPLGTALLRYPFILTVMTVGIFVLEWVGPLLLFSPKLTGKLRLAVAGSLAAMHLAIEVTLTVGLFSFVSITGLLLFLPAEFWESPRLRRLRPARPETGPGKEAVALMAPPGAEVGEANSPRSPVGSVERPAGSLAPFRAGEVPWWQSRPVQGVCLVLACYVLFLNLSGLPGRLLGDLAPAQSSFLRTACGLGQKWNMFDEIPSKDGWYVAWARLEDGSEIDLLRDGAPVNWDRPPYPAGMYPNHRWRKCFREMAYFDQMGYQVFRAPVGQYLCRQWNRQQPANRRIAEFDFVYCMESKAEDFGSSKLQVTLRERFRALETATPAGNRPVEGGF